jgi:molecular chaperone GrpE (heat shock protein)
MSNENDIRLHREISELSARVERVQADVQNLYKIVTKQNESLNRWRGMGAALTMIGVVFGGLVGGVLSWFATFVMGR